MGKFITYLFFTKSLLAFCGSCRLAAFDKSDEHKADDHRHGENGGIDQPAADIVSARA